MCIVAIDAVISLARAFGKIPVPRHASMSTMLIVAKLRTMALSAQLHHIRECNLFAIR